jgi:prepilin-type N-terminal cleavage/methylation domain-containing protein
MGTRFKQGFTIIETMLVLAITGVLIATLLVGVGSSINAQRYKDSVSSLTSLLQDQYSMADNVTNDHPTNENETCGAGAIATPNAAGVAPGESDCVLMGRYLSIVNDTISQTSVLGYQKSNLPTTSDVADITTNYDLGISDDSIQTSTLEWGAQIAWPKSGLDTAPATVTPPPPNRSIAILFLRSPDSGTTYTFTSNTVFDTTALTSADLLAMVVANTGTVPGQMQRFICVDPDGGSAALTTALTVPEKLSVTIDQAAASAASVEQRSDSVNTSLGQVSSCNQ